MPTAQNASGSENYYMAKDNTGRVLTLRVTITDPEKAKWLWNLHAGRPHEGKNLNEQLGIEIHALGDGDKFAEADKLEEQLDWLLQDVSSNRTANSLREDLMHRPGLDTPAMRELLAKLEDG